MSFEKYKRIYEPNEDITLRYGDSTEFVFNCTDEDVKNKAHRLFFTGETGLFYFWKGEYDCVSEYVNIEDALDNKRAWKAPYCLDLTNKEAVNYPKVTFKKIVFPPMLSYLRLHSYTDKWTAGVFAKANGLNIYKEDGYIKMTVEVRYKKPPFPNKYTNEEPDEVYTIEIPGGTYDWQELKLPITLPKDKVANVICFIEGEGYTGEILLERPFLTSENGYNVLPDFQPPYLAHDEGSWLGHNLSRKEWPEFELKLNGVVFYNGEMFERCHRYSEVECNIPDGLVRVGENRLDIKLVSSYPNPLPYNIHEVGYFIKENDDINIISCPENAAANSELCILVRTTKPDMVLNVTADETVVISLGEYVLKEPGLNVIKLYTRAPANNVDITIKSQNCTKTCNVKSILIKSEDDVTTGTGDIIYVNQERFEDMEEYIEWYMSNNIGNLLTIRPTYRWAGARVLNEDVWRYTAELMNKLNMKYVHMTDGREFPGGTANPSLEMLQGKGFLGRQSHEYDGAFIYWGHNEVTGIYNAVSDYWMRLNRNYPDIVNTRSMVRNWTYNTENGKLYNYLDPNTIPEDMEEAANFLVWNLKDSRCDHTRHTGPSVAFKYFYQAGYDWSAAELIYGPLEMITAFMRGAAYCYDSKTIGGHLAIQWSTTPHDTEDRYRRFRASLYASYIQGIHDINTEEGLWHLEEYYSYFNRESDACLNHKKQQQDLYSYISSHSRTGSFYAPFAFVFGRYDGFRSFGRDTIFAGNDYKTDSPELAWELLNIFYPLEVANGEIYLHPCPNDREIGMLSGTPRGNVDAVPIETSVDKLAKYKVLAFVGFNKALDIDMAKLEEYVSNGGKLIIGLPHLSQTSLRGDVLSLNHKYIKHDFVKHFAEDFDFAEELYLGKAIHVNRSVKLDNAEVIKSTDEGTPLLIKYTVGEGVIYFINAKEYPGEGSSSEPVYRDIITFVSDELNNAEESFIECDERVQFTVFEQADSSRHIYVLPVDWYNDPNELRSATLKLCGNSYDIKMPFELLTKIVVKNNAAAWVDTETAEVLSVNGDEVKVQGRGKCKLYFAKDNKLNVLELDLTKNAVMTVKI